MTAKAIKSLSKPNKLEVMAELEEAIDDDAMAVVTFVIREPDSNEDATVKVLALMPPGAAPHVEPLIHEAFAEVVSRTPREPHDVTQDMVECFHGKSFEELPPQVQAYWEFNEDLAQLLDILVERQLVRKPILTYYTPLKQFVQTGDFVLTPELYNFVEEGPKINGEEIPAICWIVASQLTDIDPLDPPEGFGGPTPEHIAKLVQQFLYAVAEKEHVTCA